MTVRVWANHFQRHFERYVVYARSEDEAMAHAVLPAEEGWGSGPSLIGTTASDWPQGLGLHPILGEGGEHAGYSIRIHENTPTEQVDIIYAWLIDRAHQVYHPEKHSDRTRERHTANPFVPDPPALRDREHARSMRRLLMLSDLLAILNAKDWDQLLDYDVVSNWPTARRGWAMGSTEALTVTDHATGTAEYTISKPIWMPKVTKRLSLLNPPIGSRIALARMGSQEQVPPIKLAASGSDKTEIQFLSNLHNVSLHAPSNITTLAFTRVSGLTLTFANGRFTATAAHSMTETTVSWQTSHSGARAILQVKDTAGNWKTLDHTQAVHLEVGKTEMRIVVTAEDAETKGLHLIDVTREAT